MAKFMQIPVLDCTGFLGVKQAPVFISQLSVASCIAEMSVAKYKCYDASGTLYHRNTDRDCPWAVVWMGGQSDRIHTDSAKYFAGGLSDGLRFDDSRSLSHGWRHGVGGAQAGSLGG